MRTIFFIILISMVCFSFSSCSSYAFIIDSNPKEADIRIVNGNGETFYTGKTPAEVAQKHIPKGDYAIILSKSGYEELVALTGNSKNLRLKKMNLGTRTLKKMNADN